MPYMICNILHLPFCLSKSCHIEEKRQTVLTAQAKVAKVAKVTKVKYHPNTFIPIEAAKQQVKLERWTSMHSIPPNSLTVLTVEIWDLHQIS